MNQKPKPAKEPIIDAKRWKTIIFYSSVLALTSIGAVIFSHYMLHTTEAWSRALCNNILFFSLILSQLLHVFNMGKTGINYFKSEVFRNKYVWIAVLASLTILFGLCMIEPVRKVLSVNTMSAGDWVVIVSSAILSTIIIQTVRALKIIKQ